VRYAGYLERLRDRESNLDASNFASPDTLRLRCATYLAVAG
jgi:hypothetical protein